MASLRINQPATTKRERRQAQLRERRIAQEKRKQKSDRSLFVNGLWVLGALAMLTMVAVWLNEEDYSYQKAHVSLLILCLMIALVFVIMRETIGEMSNALGRMLRLDSGLSIREKGLALWGIIFASVMVVIVSVIDYGAIGTDWRIGAVAGVLLLKLMRTSIGSFRG